MLSRVAAHSVHGLISGGGITPNEATQPIIYDDIRRALSSLVTILVGTLLYLPDILKSVSTGGLFRNPAA